MPRANAARWPATTSRPQALALIRRSTARQLARSSCSMWAAPAHVTMLQDIRRGGEDDTEHISIPGKMRITLVLLAITSSQALNVLLSNDDGTTSAYRARQSKLTSGNHAGWAEANIRAQFTSLLSAGFSVRVSRVAYSGRFLTTLTCRWSFLLLRKTSRARDLRTKRPPRGQRHASSTVARQDLPRRAPTRVIVRARDSSSSASE